MCGGAGPWQKHLLLRPWLVDNIRFFHRKVLVRSLGAPQVEFEFIALTGLNDC